MLSNKQIGDLIGRSKQAVSFYCFKNKIKSKRLKIGDRKYFHDEHYFSKKNLKNCYHGGFLMADGYIQKDKNSWNLLWSAAIKDEGVLHEFKKSIQFSGEIKDYIKGETSKSKTSKQKILSIYGCKQIVDDLADNFGVTYNKTHRCVVQNFENEDQKLAFMIGLLDGDGSVFGAKNGKEPTIKLYGCSLPTIEWFDKTVRELKLPKISNGKERNVVKKMGENCYYCTVNGVEAAFLYKKLMNIDVPKLGRKWLNPLMIKSVEIAMARWDRSNQNPKNHKV